MSHPHPLVEEIREKLAIVGVSDEAWLKCSLDEYYGPETSDLLSAAPRLIREALSYIEALEQEKAELTRVQGLLCSGVKQWQEESGRNHERAEALEQEIAKMKKGGA
jgi:hypothetical protein